MTRLRKVHGVLRPLLAASALDSDRILRVQSSGTCCEFLLIIAGHCRFRRPPPNGCGSSLRSMSVLSGSGSRPSAQRKTKPTSLKSTQP